MPHLFLQTISLHYHHRYISSHGFNADIKMNPRDAMVFAELQKLSWEQSDEVVEAELIEFRDQLYKEYGGKVITILSPTLFENMPQERLEVLKNLVNRVFTPGNGILKLITREAADAAFKENVDKAYVKEHFAKFVSGELRVLSQQEIAERIPELSEFKNVSGLVNEQKVSAGFYNEIAEKHKCANPFVTHVVIVNQANEFVACGMWTMVGDVAYGGDYALRPDFKSQGPEQHSGMSRVLGAKMFAAALEQNPAIRAIIFIGGVQGNLDYISKSLYGPTGFKSISLETKHDPEAQRKHGFILHFTGPGPKLLQFMHRNPAVTDPNMLSTLDDVQVVEKARKQVLSTPLRVYAATIPGPQAPIQRVLGISTFQPVIVDSKSPQPEIEPQLNFGK